MDRFSCKFFVAAITLCLASIGSVLAQNAPAQSASGSSQFFPFVIPWDDSTAGNAIDVSWLNDGPAGSHGYIVAKDGHFYESKSHKRIRFLGTNFTFDADFPSHQDAEMVAAHLAKLGINIVRIHHEDVDGGKLWDARYKDNQHFDADAIDRLDYLIYQIKLHGIYVDLNLHVSRQFTADDGFPASIADLKEGYDKRVDYFDPRMIELQKSYARQYLGRVNPYTKMSYTQDPCVVMIEINNEDSLVSNAAHWGAGGLDDLPEPFRGELATRWNAWLKAKYGNDLQLSRAWMAGVDKPGASLITSSATWRFVPASAVTVGLAPATAPQPAEADCAPAVDFKIPAVTAPATQAVLGGIDLKNDHTYTVTFKARADQTRSMRVLIENDRSGSGRGYGSTDTLGYAPLGPDLQTYTYAFNADGITPGHGQISFTIGDQKGEVWIQDVRIQPGADLGTIVGDGNMVDATVPMPSSATTAEIADWVRFLTDIEDKYASDMRSFVKKDLHAHANIICSQISWGASEGLYRERNMDLADNHSYWQHPQFPGAAWSPDNWLIGNTPMTAAMASGSGGTLRGLAQNRVSGKPYTITEYNEPAPNDYRCEFVPELSSFGANQDWDAVFLFEWGQYGAGAPNDMIQPGFFACCSDPARAAFVPSAALIFRGYQVRPIPRVMTLSVPLADSVTGKAMGGEWTAAGIKDIDCFSTQLAVRLSTKDTTPEVATTELPDSDNASMPADRFTQHGSDPAGAYFTVGGEAAFGYLGGKEVELGPNKIDVEPFGNGFCTVTIVDSSPHPDVKRTLVTIVGKVENTNQVWNAARTSVNDHWGNAPSRAEYVPATISVPARSDEKVFALDGSGKRTKTVDSTVADGQITFHTDPSAQTVWYEVGD